MPNEGSATIRLYEQYATIPTLQTPRQPSRTQTRIDADIDDTDAVYDGKGITFDMNKELANDVLDRELAWFVMVGCLLANIIICGITKSSGVFYLQFQSYFRQSAEVTSWSVTLNNALYVLLGPIASALCNRFSVRTVVALGATLCTAGTFLPAFSPDIYFLYPSFGLLLGIGFGFVYGPCLILLSQYFDKRLSLAAGIATSGAAFSSCVSSVVLELSFDHFGFFSTFLILSAITSNFYVSAVLFRPKELQLWIAQQERSKKLMGESTLILQTRQKNGELLHTQLQNQKSFRNDTAEVNRKQELAKSAQEKSGKDEQQLQNKQKLLDISLLKNTAFLCFCIQMFMVSLSLDTVLTYLPAFALEKGMDPTQGAYLLTILGVFDGAQRIFMSICLDFDHIRPYRLVIFNSNIYFIAVCTLVFPYMSTYRGFCVSSALYGVLIAIAIPQMSVLCIDILGAEHLTSSFGLLLAFEGVGSLLTPAVGGMIKDCLGSFDVAFYVGSGGAFVGGVVMTVGNVWFYKRNNNSYHTFS